MKKYKVLVALFLMAGMGILDAAPASLKEAQASLNNAKRLHNKGQSEEVISILSKLAEEDYPPAQYFLGTLYSLGDGVEKDEKKAFHWISSAAYYGYAKAQNSLGLMYDEGWGVRKNDETAAHWYFQAANQGLTKAQVNIGMMFCLGEGARKDMVQCARWIKKAKNKGSKNAENVWIGFELEKYYIKEDEKDSIKN